MSQNSTNIKESNEVSDEIEQDKTPPVGLDKFFKNNEHVTFKLDEKKIILENIWGENDIRLGVDLTDISLIDNLNSITFDLQFDAIIHKESKQIEFIFGFLDTKDQIQSRFPTCKVFYPT